MTTSPEAISGKSEQIIPFSRFLHLPDEDIHIGMRVGPLSPSKLYVSQSWIDEEKLDAALKVLLVYQGKPLVIPLYVHRLHFESGGTHRIAVIADFHHRTLVWAVNGLRIDGEIVATAIPDHLKPREIIPFSVFRRSHEAKVSTL